MLYVKFIQNWSNSELTNTGTPETPAYAYDEPKNTSVYSDGLKLKDIDYDAESYMADDFFLREPREAKIELFRDDDDWLRDNFLYQNDNEINHVLYMDEDGTILEYEGIDPDLSIGDQLDGGTIDDKEVLIQQFSKIIVEIWDTNSGIVFTGLVDKSQTSATHKRITLNCVDFTGLIKIFGEQLIKIIIDDPDIEDYYQFIVSINIIDELFDKIKNFTKLEITTSNGVENYTNGIVTNNNNNLDINDYDIIWEPDNQYYNGDVETFQDVSIFASDEEKAFIIYKCFTWSKTYETSDPQQYTVTDFYLTILAYEWNVDGISGVNYATYLLAYHGPPGDIVYMTAINAVKQFQTVKLMAAAFIDDDLLINYVAINSSGNYDIIQITQDRYSVAIPIYADTYEYMELFKTILFLNILTIYADGNGNINVKSKYFEDEVEGASTIINERDIMDGYTLGAIEKDEIEMSDALEPIWYDTETEGALYDNLDNKMKEEFSELFISRFPIEFNGSIKYNSVDIGTINDIIIGSKLEFFDRDWIVISKQLNKTNFSTKIKAFGLGEISTYIPGPLLLTMPLIRNEELNNTLDLAAGTEITVSSIDTDANTITLSWLPDIVTVVSPTVGKEWALLNLNNFSVADPGLTGDYEDIMKITSGTYSTKVLNYTAVLGAEGNWNVGDRVALYNALDTGWDWKVDPLIEESGAGWREVYVAPSGIFQKIDGTYVMLVLGKNSANVKSIGAFSCNDPSLESWSVMNGDAAIFTHGAYAWCANSISMYKCMLVEGETDRYIAYVAGDNAGSVWNIGYVKFNEDFSNIVWSADSIIDSSAYADGFTGASVINHNGMYRMMVVGRSADILTEAWEVVEATSTTQEGPFINQEVIMAGITDNQGIFNSSHTDAFSYFKYDGKLYCIIGGTSRWRESGNKVNRIYGLMKFNDSTETWTILDQSPLFMNPLAGYYMWGADWAWGQDHLGGTPTLNYYNGKLYNYMTANNGTDAYKICQFSIEMDDEFEL